MLIKCEKYLKYHMLEEKHLLVSPFLMGSFMVKCSYLPIYKFTTITKSGFAALQPDYFTIGKLPPDPFDGSKTEIP
jgi:hypothetical protein